MHRDKEETRKKILDAVGYVLTHSGMGEVGVNSIAKQAGVDKVLIYRYFGNLDELLRTYAEESDLWPSTPDLLGDKANIRRTSDVKEVINSLLINQLNEIRRRKVTQEILRWEISEDNVLTKLLNSAREKQAADIVNGLSLNQQSSKDLEALMALINAGVTYLVLRSKVSDKHLGIDLHSNFGWQRLSKLISELVTEYLKSANDSIKK
jgi:AcrR family transcriptional regulator